MTFVINNNPNEAFKLGFQLKEENELIKKKTHQRSTTVFLS